MCSDDVHDDLDDDDDPTSLLLDTPTVGLSEIGAEGQKVQKL